MKEYKLIIVSGGNMSSRSVIANHVYTKDGVIKFMDRQQGKDGLVNILISQYPANMTIIDEINEV